MSAALCDLLIVGAGPAGMAAALAAAPTGASICLIDDNPAPGGQIWRDGPALPLPPLAAQYRERLARCVNVRVFSGTRVVGLGARAAGDEAPALLLEDAERGWTQRCRRLLLCTGARERLLPFPGWTLPGVTGAGGLQALIKAGVPVRGERIVIAGSGPLLLALAQTAEQAGARVLRIAEQAGWAPLAGFALQLARWPAKAAQAAGLAHRGLRAASHVLAAEGACRVQVVQLRRGRAGEERIACDRLACGFGLTPNTELAQMLGCALDARGGIAVDARQASSVAGVWAAGECTGVGGSDKALAEGAIAGQAALGEGVIPPDLIASRARWMAFSATLDHFFALNPALRTLARDDTLVCRCEDVAHGALRTRSGWIDAKLHTRCGMGACQGRICGAAARELYGWTPQPGRHLLAPARVATLIQAGEAADNPTP